MSKEPININNDNVHYEAHQREYNRGKGTQKDPSMFTAEATVAV